MGIRKIDKNIGTIPNWGDDDFDENVHQNFTDLKTIIPAINNTIDDIDLSIAEMNILKDKAENVTTTASNSAFVATQKASEASTSANQALTYKNQLQGYVIPAGTSYSVEQINTQNSAMKKAQFLALCEERKANRAGSGFDEWGNHTSNTNYPNVNEGIWTIATIPNTFIMGRAYTDTIGVSKTNDPITIINGVRQKISMVNRLVGVGAAYDNNAITLPTAPTIYPHDTVLTPEQIASGVIKHADSSNSGLIVNGKFAMDTSGWLAINATLSSINGELNIVLSANDGGAYQPRTTVVGKSYIVEIDVISKDSFTSIYIANSPGAPYLNKLLVLGKNIFEFTATASTTYFQIHCGTTNGTFKFDSIAVYPADAISRSDLVFPESYHEDIAEKGFGYPFGNVQYLGGNTDGLTGITNGAFSGFETYSLFGNWQTQSSLVGKGYVWSSLTEVQKRAFIANPENNCYLDGDKTIQVRYRVRVRMGEDSNSMGRATVQGKAVVPSTVLFTAPVTTVDAGLYSNTSAMYTYTGTSTNAISIATISRRNQGMYHNVFNPNGTKLASDGLDCFRTTISFTSISDCFDPAKLLTSSGYIGTVSGRPDGLFYDQVHESDITDLRNSSKKVEDYNRLITREFNKLIAGTIRGFEGEKYTEITTQTTTGTVATVQVKNGTRYKRGDVIYIYDLTASSVKGRFVVISISTNTLTVDTAFAKLANSYMISGASSTRTKSNTLLACDVIGNPSNYPSVWKTNEVTFTTLHTAEDGTSLLPDGTRDTFKLSRDANATPLLCLRSTDNGATWVSFTPTFSTTTNTITLTDEPAGNIVLVYYQTKTSIAAPTVNNEVLEIGNTFATSFMGHSPLVQSLIGKVATYAAGGVGNIPTQYLGKPTNYNFSSSNNAFVNVAGYNDIPQNKSVSLTGVSSPAVKVFPYLTKRNAKAYLGLIFKEMKHNGTSWGDDSKFNIVDNVSTTTDLNAQNILYGTKEVEINMFVGADE